MASHILDEVEKICSHVAILKEGKLIAEGPVGTILEDSSIVEVGVAHESISSFEEWIENQSDMRFLNRDGELYLLSTEPDFKPEDLNRNAFEEGILLSHLKLRKRSLEEEFLSLTK